MLRALCPAVPCAPFHIIRVCFQVGQIKDIVTRAAALELICTYCCARNNVPFRAGLSWRAQHTGRRSLV